MIHYISSEWLTIERLEEIFDNKYQIALSDDAIKRISHCRSYLDEKMKIRKSRYMVLLLDSAHCAIYR